MSDRIHATSARRIVLWTLAIFAVIQLGTITLIECWIPHFRDPFYVLNIRHLRDCLCSCATKPKTVFLFGSSRVQDGVNALLIERDLTSHLGCAPIVYNFAQGGFNNMDALVYFKRLLAENPSPDLVVIEVWPPLLSPGKPGRGRLPYSRLSLLELARLDTFYRDHWGLNPGPEFWFIPWYSNRDSILNAVLSPNYLSPDLRLIRTSDVRGWTPHDFARTASEWHRALVRNAETFDALFQHYSLSEPLCQSLREMLTLCKRAQIQPLLLFMPESKDFQGFYTSSAWMHFSLFLQETIRESGAFFTNARDWVDEEYLYDPIHLNAAGANLLSKRLAQEVMLPILSPAN
jgi:hypothetical protein